MMNRTRIILFCLCLLFTTSFGDGTSGQTRNNSEEISGEQNSKQTKCQENDCDIDYINSNETGPLDSHEAMNTRELKARNKRSTEVDKKAFRNMLLGLVRKKSQDMKVELQDVDDASEIRVEPQKLQSDASELLLELMVRIAAHPQQWDEVHELLQRIDTDIVTSKKILSDLKNVAATTVKPATITTESGVKERSTTTDMDQVQKLIILLDDEEQYAKKKSNESRKIWPNLDDDYVSSSSSSSKATITSTQNNMYPWSSKAAAPGKNLTAASSTRDFEFSYHRVTGLPLPYRSNYDKARARNAYIAVSVIAPKSRDVRLEKQGNLLEDELRQLKPWSHEENLSKMENIRKKWFIRSDKPMILKDHLNP